MKKIQAIIIINVNSVSFNVMEVYKNNIFSLFYSFTITGDNLEDFILHSIEKANKKLNIQISELVFVIPNVKKTNLKIIERNNTIIANGSINESHIEKTLEFQKNSLTTNNEIAILSRPYKYLIYDKENKATVYDEIPIGVHAYKLKTLSVISYINNDIYRFIKKICKKIDIRVKTILTYSHLNQFLLENEKILNNKENVILNINEKNSTFNLYRNNVLIFAEIITFGANYIYSQIEKDYENVSVEEAAKIFKLYCSFKNYDDSNPILTNINLTTQKLNKYAFLFFEKLFTEINNKLNLADIDVINLTGELNFIPELENVLNAKFRSQAKYIVNNFTNYQLSINNKYQYIAIKYINSMLKNNFDNNILITKPMKILKTVDFISNTSENFIVS